MSGRGTAIRVLQWSLIVTGLILIGFWVGARIHSARGQSSEIRRFEDARLKTQEQKTATAAKMSQSTVTLPTDLPVDTSLWAEDRIKEFEESLAHDFDAPLAILRIPSINLEVAVLEGTTELVLNRGVGHIGGTPLPGQEGNIGIAGHRDGYFRRLKDVAVGDLMEVETLTGTRVYAITELFLVEPPDIWVLNPTETPAITLVTCYPFYYVGSAPQRYIVRAERTEE